MMLLEDLLMDLWEIKKVFMKDLVFKELVEISGGSKESYEAGKRAGKATRDFIDDLGAVGALIGAEIFILSRGRIHI